jgi:hypothetical protein
LVGNQIIVTFAPIVKEYAMKQVLEDLKEAGFIKEED